MTAPGERIVCAIDTADLDEAKRLADRVAGAVGSLKIGLQFYVAHGAAGVAALAETGLPIFLDLKFHDIPNTVAGAVRAAAAAAPAMLTVHAGGGAAMMRAAAAAAMRLPDRSGGARPKVLAVTVLTSFDRADAESVGLAGSIEELVTRSAALAQASASTAPSPRRARSPRCAPAAARISPSSCPACVPDGRPPTTRSASSHRPRRCASAPITW